MRFFLFIPAQRKTGRVSIETKRYERLVYRVAAATIMSLLSLPGSSKTGVALPFNTRCRLCLLFEASQKRVLADTRKSFCESANIAFAKAKDFHN
jgi:hypothetical protein